MMDLLMELMVCSEQLVWIINHIFGFDFQNPKISYHTQHKNAFLYANKHFNKIGHL